MSPTSKKLLKIVLIVLAIDLVIAAVPVAFQVYQTVYATPAPLPALAVTYPSAVPPALVMAKPTAGAPLSLAPALNPTATPAVTAAAVVTAAATDAPVLTPTPVPVVLPGSQRAGSKPAALSAAPIRLPGQNNTDPNTYLLLPMYAPAGFPYQAQPGTPIFIQNFAHPNAGCGWMSVAGQVLDATGNPLTKLVVVVSGVLNGSPVQLIGLTGMAPEYGPGGYELQLSSAPVASTASLTIQVFDLTGSPVTGQIPFSTSASCSENVVLINFTP